MNFNFQVPILYNTWLTILHLQFSSEVEKKHYIIIRKGILS